MINSIQYKSGFALELPAIGKKLCKFGSGINVLVGSNGCGKSTIIKTLKGYCAIKNGGWTKPSEPNKVGIGRTADWNDYPDCYSTYTPANCKATVTWDGTPTFFNDGDIKLEKLSYFYNFKEDFSDGITDDGDIDKALQENPSAGQYRLNKLNKVINLIKAGAPEYTEADFGNYPDKDDIIYSKREWQFWQYINKLYVKTYGAGKNTILLDEPERSLSFPKQKELFLDIIPNQLKDFQVIIASHSPYALFIPTAGIIEMEAGFVDGFKDAIKDIGKFLSGEAGQMEMKF